ncbi:MAG TPA: hypothetical protein VNH42_06525 [Mariprofundaceae bacterium]|nr:hypothetical protein [Mariprofundaceae bacterium]
MIASAVTYLLMVLAWRFHRPRVWHVTIMAVCMLYDLCVPFYLFFARHWMHLLFDKGEILDFLVWMHVGLDILLFVIYALQIRAGLQLWRGVPGVRETHRQQGNVIIVVRFLVLLSGALLAPK